MGLISYILLCALVGVIVWAILYFLPQIPKQIKTLIIVAAVVVLILILLSAMGLIGRDVQIPQVGYNAHF